MKVESNQNWMSILLESYIWNYTMLNNVYSCELYQNDWIEGLGFDFIGSADRI